MVDGLIINEELFEPSTEAYYNYISEKLSLDYIYR